MPRPGKIPLIALSMGDPAGIGPEVIIKAATALAARPEPPALLVLGELDLLREVAQKLGGAMPAFREWSAGMRPIRVDQAIAVRTVGQLTAVEPGHPTVAGAAAAYRYVVEGARMALRGEVSALVTAPISKEWLNRAGYHFPGHSELLARLARVRTWRMMFAGDLLRLALVTVHIGLAQVAPALTVNGIWRTIVLLADHLRYRVGIAQPRIIVLGFNPHAGENGLFGDEEARVIMPAIDRARRQAIEVRGPVAPDTAFVRNDGRFTFDGAVAMYHDQGLIALKTLEFERAVNITLGLPFIRTAPDHGTAYNIAGGGVASATSMLAAIDYAAGAARSSTGGGRRVHQHRAASV